MEPKSTKNKKTKPTTPFEIGNIQGKTPRQKQFFQKFKDYQVLSLCGFAGTGKAQPLDCKILTPVGWIYMGNVKVGDKVFDKDGKVCSVTAVYPQGVTECYKLTFRDGSSTRAHGDHLWYGYISRNGGEPHKQEVVTTNNLIEIFNNYKNAKFSIPLMKPNKGEDINLPLDPYLLGLIIGDGCTRQDRVSFTTKDTSLEEEFVGRVLKIDSQIEIKKRGISLHTSNNRKENKLKTILYDLGLMNKLSYDKFIPDIYKQASYSQKKDLLSGLLDTDGTVGRNDISLSTTSISLAQDVQDLVRSLGGRSRIRKIKTKSKFGVSYTVSITLFDKLDLFKLERKKNKLSSPDKDQYWNKLVSIEKIEDCETQCISVDSDSHTYITDDYIVTHNTFCALAAALKSVEKGEHAEVLIIRSAVPSREIGFMPGGKKEKISVYESPYTSICTKLYNRGDAYSILKQKGILQFESTSFLRGETFDNKILLIDEAQNMSDIELFTILTRVGVNCKVIICGDAMQDDLTSERYKERSGYLKMLTILQGMDEVLNIEFGVDDIVRSGFVKSLIIRYNEKD